MKRNTEISRIYPSKYIELIVQNRFTGSFMNNAKWVKMLNALTNNFQIIFIDYKLIYNDSVKGCLFDMPDFEPFFIEPILYKEVEWIEFPKSYEYWVNENNLKAGKAFYNQDLAGIKGELDALGKFELEFYSNKIRLHAYR